MVYHPACWESALGISVFRRCVAWHLRCLVSSLSTMSDQDSLGMQSSCWYSNSLVIPDVISWHVPEFFGALYWRIPVALWRACFTPSLLVLSSSPGYLDGLVKRLVLSSLSYTGCIYPLSFNEALWSDGPDQGSRRLGLIGFPFRSLRDTFRSLGRKRGLEVSPTPLSYFLWLTAVSGPVDALHWWIIRDKSLAVTIYYTSSLLELSWIFG